MDYGCICGREKTHLESCGVQQFLVTFCPAVLSSI